MADDNPCAKHGERLATLEADRDSLTGGLGRNSESIRSLYSKLDDERGNRRDADAGRETRVTVTEKGVSDLESAVDKMATAASDTRRMQVGTIATLAVAVVVTLLKWFLEQG